MARRGLLLDRDGVVNVDNGYVGRIDHFTFLPGLFPFLQEAQDKGYRLAILTNQSGVARGLYSESDFHNLTAYMLAQLSRKRIAIDLVLASFEHPEGNGIYRRESFWRKPNPGMVCEAVQRLNLDPARSAFLGDQPRDLQAAQAGGIKTRLWLGGDPAKAEQGVTTVKNFVEAARFLDSHGPSFP